MSKEFEIETFLFVFKTESEAEYWMRETIDVFKDSILNISKHPLTLNFPEAVYIFVSESQLTKYKGLHESHRYGLEELCIILNDPERTLLETYEDSSDDFRD